MNKDTGKGHQKFFNSFIKVSIISTALIVVVLGLLYFFLVV